MIRGGEAFTHDDKLAYEWLMDNMRLFLAGTYYEKNVPAFEMVLTNAWQGGEKIFFDIELLGKLQIAISCFLPQVPSEFELMQQNWRL